MFLFGILFRDQPLEGNSWPQVKSALTASVEMKKMDRAGTSFPGKRRMVAVLAS